MPELPEVETTRRGLEPLLGQTVTQVFIRNAAMRWPIPPHLAQTLPQQKLLALHRRGKYILARFGSDEAVAGTLILHLGMSGRVCLLEHDEPPGKHDHFDLYFSDGRVLRLRDPRRFGAVLWLEGEANQHLLLDSLGPEPLDEGFDGAWLYRNTRRRTGPIKNVIMDSRLVVGVGNIYASESLFRAGISPLKPASKLTKLQCERLAVEIKATLQDALKAGGSSLRDFFGADGNPGYFQQAYYVYGRTGKPCKRCGQPIRMQRIGQRSSFYCAHCQR